MNHKQIISLLRENAAEVPQRTAFCPDDQEIVEYFEDHLEESERECLQRHLVECGFCRSRLGVLSRLSESMAENKISASLLAKTKQLAAGRPQRTGWRLAPAWASAAVAVLALALFLGNRPGLLIGPDSAPENFRVPIEAADDARQFRNLQPVLARPRVLAPLDGASINPAGLEVSWTEMPGALFYDLYVLSDSGDLLVKERVTGTQWKADQSLTLASGSEYFLRVEAHLQDASTANSEHVIFKVGERD
jgi:hypothetical protein